MPLGYSSACRKVEATLRRGDCENKGGRKGRCGMLLVLNYHKAAAAAAARDDGGMQVECVVGKVVQVTW